MVLIKVISILEANKTEKAEFVFSKKETSSEVMTMPTIDSPDDLSDQRTSSDVELRELVYQSLERDGLIGRLKAQLRAAVFKTIEKASNPSNSTPTLPSFIHDSTSSTGRICHGLVFDWLEHSRLLYTQDVLKVETTGANHSAPLTKNELVQQLHLGTAPSESRSLLQALLEKSNTTTTTTATTAAARPSGPISFLPDNVKQSIDTQFPSEKINDLNRVREHFRSLFSSAFDSIVLDAFLNKMIPSTLSSIAKYEYEQICLKWMQACTAALTPTIVPSKQQSSPAAPAPTQPLPARNAAAGGNQTTRARRATSPPSDSTSSSSSTSQSDHPRRGGFNFPLPTTLGTNKSVVKKSTDEAPPPLVDFGGGGDDDDGDDTSTSLLSKRNATPASLNRLKNIDDIIRGGGDETPRTRTNIQKLSNTNGNKETPVEYDDESQISSVDDVTVDKASPSPSAHIDFLEDL